MLKQQTIPNLLWETFSACGDLSSSRGCQQPWTLKSRKKMQAPNFCSLQNRACRNL